MAGDIRQEIANYLLNNCFIIGNVDATREKYYYVINHEEAFRESVDGFSYLPRQTKLWKIHGSLGWKISNGNKVRVESESPKQELRHVSQDWYISKPGNGLDDMPYFTVVGNNKRPASREEFKLPDRGLEKAPSQAEARRRICRTLGIGDADAPQGKKFNEVFHMGTSLEDINDIRKFIYTYILPEPEIDIEILHKDMRELERLQEILEEAQEKEKLLKDIMGKLVQAKELDSKIKINEALVSYANWQDAKEKQDKELSEIEEAKNILEKCDFLLGELENKREEAQKLYDQASDEKNRNEENKALDYLKDLESSKSKEYKELIRNVQKFYDAIDKLERLLEKLNSTIIYT